MARSKSADTNTSTATIGFEAKLRLTAEQAVPAPHFGEAEYNRARPEGLLGLIFFKYISDTAGQCRMSNAEIRTRNARPLRHSKFVIRHCPAPAIGKTVDDANGGRARAPIERDNPRLKGVLPKDYARPGLDTAARDSASPDCEAVSRDFCAAKDHQRLGELIAVIAIIELTAASKSEKTHRSVDLLGRVYEYFLTRFASAEGKNGGVAKCEVRNSSVEVKTSRPFVIPRSIRHSTFGFRHLPFLALRGTEADFGPEHADTFRRDLHPDLRAA